MPTELTAPTPAWAPRWTLSAQKTRHAVLWLLLASSSLVLIEPSPYEALFALAILVYGPHLGFPRGIAPLAMGLVLFNIGGMLALIPWTDDHDSVSFVVTSAYISLTTIFFACLVAQDSLRRLAIIRSGYLVAAVIGSIAGIVGYFDIAGLGDVLSKYDRASGTFKDPNVLGPFLVLPIVWMVQQALLGELPRGLIKRLGYGAVFLIMAFALFLTFSRGAWGVCAASVMLMIGLTFIETRSTRLRTRIVVCAILGFLALVALLAFALSFPALSNVFMERASLNQSYDLGETGRFGNQWRSLPMLLVAPNGFGPKEFWRLFDEDPHNIYVNAFASYGWLGGLSYCTIVVMTLYLGWWLVFRRTPLQAQAIAVWSCLFVQLLQGFQIDTDHWRHLFLMLGCVWGLATATNRIARQESCSRRIGNQPTPAIGRRA
jgi:hypothetical protein